MSEKINFRNIKSNDWPNIEAIFQHGITSGNATFEHETGSWDIWDQIHCKEARVLAYINDETVGWAALKPVSQRKAYRGVVESRIYIDEKYKNQGIGSKLLNELILQSEAAGYWTLEAFIFPENKASIALHKKYNYELIGTRKKIGVTHDGTFRDVILFERRSNIAGKF
jgi:phosphinothricin acetyltransferase